ncbi:MAG: hypothetical protein IPH97_10335 [Ignavibacteriales bacterium]|nr:hypothetical protein [Ignavibacteriales bacterium]
MDRWLISNQTYLQTSISTNQYHKDISVDSLGKPTFKNKSMDIEYVLRSDFSHRFSQL